MVGAGPGRAGRRRTRCVAQEKLLDTDRGRRRGAAPYVAASSLVARGRRRDALTCGGFDKLKLSPLWESRRGVAAWYDRIRARPSFQTAVEDWVTPADHERYANEPDPWPKVRAILRAA